MEPSNTPESCHKINQDDYAEERAYRRKTRKRLIIISVSSIVFIGAVLCAVIGTVLPAKTSDTPQDHTSPNYSESNLDAICNVTSNYDSCVSSISSYMKMMKISDPNPSPEEIFYLSMKVALTEMTSVRERLESCKREGSDRVAQGAVKRCHSLYVDATDRINKSISSFNVSKDEKSVMELQNVKKGLGDADEDQEKCKDVLADAKQAMICDGIGLSVDKSREYTGNSLEIESKVISSIYRIDDKPGNRKLLIFER